uniref:Ovule protein n=1 Tax=Parascaris univalens TaxID=6257 RepID=A0A914ZT07_PARUN
MLLGSSTCARSIASLPSVNKAAGVLNKRWQSTKYDLVKILFHSLDSFSRFFSKDSYGSFSELQHLNVNYMDF